MDLKSRYRSSYGSPTRFQGAASRFEHINVYDDVSIIEHTALYVMIAVVLDFLGPLFRPFIPTQLDPLITIFLIPWWTVKFLVNNILLKIVTGFLDVISYIWKTIIIVNTVVLTLSAFAFLFLWSSGILEVSGVFSYAAPIVRLSVSWYPQQWARLVARVMSFAWDWLEGVGRFLGCNVGRTTNTIEYNWALKEVRWGYEKPIILKLLERLRNGNA